MQHPLPQQRESHGTARSKQRAHVPGALQHGGRHGRNLPQLPGFATLPVRPTVLPVRPTALPVRPTALPVRPTALPVRPGAFPPLGGFLLSSSSLAASKALRASSFSSSSRFAASSFFWELHDRQKHWSGFMPCPAAQSAAARRTLAEGASLRARGPPARRSARGAPSLARAPSSNRNEQAAMVRSGAGGRRLGRGATSVSRTMCSNSSSSTVPLPSVSTCAEERGF